MALGGVMLVKIAWLAFLLADLPRLFYRHLSFRKPFDSSHRSKEYHWYRVLIQAFFQSIFYLISLGLLYYVQKNLILLGLAFLYCIPLIFRIVHQIKAKSAYVTSEYGHNINNYIIKPLRMLILLSIGFIFQQPIWLLGLAIVIVKWGLTLFYEKIFDVPHWYHFLLVILSAMLVLSIYPFDLGVVPPETLRTFFTTIPTVYAAYVGLLGVFLSITISSAEGDIELKRYFTGGIILNFSYSSVLILLSLISIIVFGNNSLSLTSVDLFSNSGKLTAISFKNYMLFGLVFSLSWLLFFYTIMTAHLMLLQTGKLIPTFWNRGNEGANSCFGEPTPNQANQPTPKAARLISNVPGDFVAGNRGADSVQYRD